MGNGLLMLEESVAFAAHPMHMILAKCARKVYKLLKSLHNFRTWA